MRGLKQNNVRDFSGVHLSETSTSEPDLGWMMGSRVKPGFGPSQASPGNLWRIPPVVRGGGGQHVEGRAASRATNHGSNFHSTAPPPPHSRTITRTESAWPAGYTHATFSQQQPRNKKEKKWRIWIAALPRPATLTTVICGDVNAP